MVNMTTPGAARPAALLARGTEATAAAEASLAAAEAAAAAAGVSVGSSGPGGMTTVWIQDGAHHIDLFFSNPADPASITSARSVELALVQAWSAAWYAEAA